MRTTLLALVTVVCLFGGSAEGAPILDGRVVETTYLFPDTSTIFTTPVNATVGAGVELANYAGCCAIDFSNTNIRITLTRNAGINDVAFDGLRFFDIFGTIPNDLDVTLNPATNYAGFDASRLSASGDTLFVNLANLPGLTGQFISIDLAQSGPGGPVVPEPTTLTLLGGGLATLVARRRNSKRRVGGSLSASQLA
jgi:hypothetical protein